MTRSGQISDIHLSFDGLDDTIALRQTASLVPLIGQVLKHWPFKQTATPPRTPPSFIISATKGGDYCCTSMQPGAEPVEWDAVNALCEMIVELAWAQIRSNRDWLCLHCAAVEISGRLVLFPNRRRAGKSTLASVLAARGFRVFTDDFIPIMVGRDGSFHGRANGILPRIRLPVPKDLPEDFRQWVAANPGPGNEQYKYLEIETLARRGATLPIGAVVLLDRNEDETQAATLQDMTTVDAVDGLISQNFAREINANRILNAAVGVAGTSDLFRLSYGSAAEAADVLEQHFSMKTPAKPQALPEAGTGSHLPDADLAFLDRARPAFVESETYGQGAGARATAVEDATYVVDGSGAAIHKLNPGSAAIWNLLAEPQQLHEIVGLYCAAFPDVASDQIHKDTKAVLENFLRNGLIEPVTGSGAG